MNLEFHIHGVKSLDEHLTMLPLPLLSKLTHNLKTPSLKITKYNQKNQPNIRNNSENREKD